MAVCPRSLGACVQLRWEPPCARFSVGNWGKLNDPNSSSAPLVEKVMCVTMAGTGTAQALGGGGAEEQPVERLLQLGAFDAFFRLLGPIGRVWTGLEAANVEAEAEGAASGSSSPPSGPMSQQSSHTMDFSRFTCREGSSSPSSGPMSQQSSHTVDFSPFMALSPQGLARS